MRVTYDPEVDAAYIYLTDEKLMSGRDSVPCDAPEGEHAFIVLDWKDGKIVGLEVLDASARLHADLWRKRCARARASAELPLGACSTTGTRDNVR